MKTYIINGRKIPFDGGGVIQEILEALDQKNREPEEKQVSNLVEEKRECKHDWIDYDNNTLQICRNCTATREPKSTLKEDWDKLDVPYYTKKTKLSLYSKILY